MNENNRASDTSPSFTDLFPEIEKDKLREAEENIDRYLELVLRIYNRIKEDPQAYDIFKALTSRKQKSNMKSK